MATTDIWLLTISVDASLRANRSTNRRRSIVNVSVATNASESIIAVDAAFRLRIASVMTVDAFVFRRATLIVP